MDEKTMVNDILEGVKSGLKTYQGVISEAENISIFFFDSFSLLACSNLYFP